MLQYTARARPAKKYFICHREVIGRRGLYAASI